ncbi:serine O-acetyltransferase [Halogranum amylolyticum]|uniref:Serine acetyltransferase n=1 Tax=Halogranum amylolyticum TaxID=660520 RepID=A0A1H8RJY4_9EURY|nr:serine O-acetyltransferase [Halogranum amylolyticum]SEO66488.1 serine O-acetyltransferase [Halogranum amylolyticum]
MVSLVSRFVEDIRTAQAKDPAARGPLEVLLTYPGLHAIWLYRVAHVLWEGGLRLPARLLSHLARGLTGVEIHPAATIGRRFFIDHGMGVVVGETAEIGDDVLMYHGVTLGGNSMRREKRHPTVEDDAVLGANSTLIGAITVGEDTRIGAGAVVSDDVPAGATIVGPKATRLDSDDEDGRVDDDAESTVESPGPAE